MKKTSVVKVILNLGLTNNTLTKKKIYLILEYISSSDISIYMKFSINLKSFNFFNKWVLWIITDIPTHTSLILFKIRWFEMTPNGSTSCNSWYLKFFPRWKSIMWTTLLVSYPLEGKKKMSIKVFLKAFWSRWVCISVTIVYTQHLHTHNFYIFILL